MGLHHRNLADTNFTGQHLRGQPSDIGSVPHSINPMTALAVVCGAIILAVFFGIGH